MKEYIALATCILPEGMLDWFILKDVRLTEADGKTTIHIYLDENELIPDVRTDLRPNGFTRESVFMTSPFVVRKFFSISDVAVGLTAMEAMS